MNDFYKKLLVIGAIFVVVLELTSLGGFGIFNAPSSNPNTPVKNQSPVEASVPVIGSAYVNATVTALRPYLVVQSLGEKTESQIRAIPGVDDVVRSQGTYAIGINELSNMKSVYLELKKMGLPSQALTSLVVDTNGELVSINGTKTPVSIQGTTIELTLQKPVEIQTKLRIKIDGAQAINGKLVAGQTVSLDFKPIETQLSGKIIARDIIHTYEYPWETRNTLNLTAIKEKYGAGTQVLRKDFFTVNASSSDVSLAAQNKTYVLNVQGNKVFVAKDFVDTDNVIADFGENIKFEPSTVKLTNQTIEGETPSKIEYLFTILLNENEYGFERVITQAEIEKTVDETVALNATLLVDGPIGDSIVSARIIE